MNEKEKFSSPEVILFIAILLILLYFPFQMAKEHMADAKSASYYVPK